MDSSLLIGTWIGLPNGSSVPASPPDCIWHVLDDGTCVYEQQTEVGLMISWFQYWPHEGGILRYPLSKGVRSLFHGKAQYVPIELADTHLTMNGYRFNRVGVMPIPDRFDVNPGTRPNANGAPIPTFFRNKLQDLLLEPPTGEEAAP